jgi:hypothetical protein
MICPQEIFDEIIDLFEAQPNERNIIQYHIHRLIIRTCVTGESIVESLLQFVSRGGVLKGENPGLILQYLASLGDRGVRSTLAGDHLFAGKCMEDAGLFMGGVSTGEALHAFDVLSNVDTPGRDVLKKAAERMKTIPISPEKPKRKPFWKL